MAANRLQVMGEHVSLATATSLAGKVVVITGAGSGIGRAAALLFAESGADLVLGDYNGETVAETASLVRQQSPDRRVTALTADVGVERDVVALVDAAVKGFGGIDVMFANAGVSGGFQSFSDHTVPDMEAVLRVNVIGVILCVQKAAEAMRRAKKGGSIVCTASVAGLRSGAGNTIYSASKAAVINTVQTVSHQLAGTNIRINAICPGLTETGMTAPVFEMARARGTVHKVGQLNPLKRAAEPVEPALAAVFLASNAASYINGQALPVCGGLSASHPVVPGKLG